MSLYDLARNLTEEYYGNDLRIGGHFNHPDHGHIVITDGQFWGTYGLSNFWSWRKVSDDGTVSKERFSGYGGDWPHVNV